MSDWQPISTAPKDGTELLLFSAEATTPIMLAHWSAAADARFSHQDDWYERDTGIPIDVAVTHWMPLPAPPELA